jgi:hypothetical protein
MSVPSRKASELALSLTSGHDDAPRSQETGVGQRQESRDMTETQEPARRDARESRVGLTALIVSVVAALAIGGLAGVAIGWKVEQSRVKDDIKNVRPVGTVTAVADGSFTVEMQTSSGTRTYVINRGTIVDRAETGDEADVAEGATVLVKSFKNADGKMEASEVVVLPDSTELGQR